VSAQLSVLRPTPRTFLTGGSRGEGARRADQQAYRGTYILMSSIVSFRDSNGALRASEGGSMHKEVQSW
jgi:hypothetical protein